MLNLHALPVWGVTLAFVAAGSLVWMAGVRLAAYAEAVSERTRDRVILGLGIDSGLVLAVYLGGVALLFSLR